MGGMENSSYTHKKLILFQCVLKRAICTVHYSLDREQNSILEKSAFWLSNVIFPVYLEMEVYFRDQTNLFRFMHLQWSLNEKEKYMLNITRELKVKK